jgi:Secretion system C-terminal sorting domain
MKLFLKSFWWSSVCTILIACTNPLSAQVSLVQDGSFEDTTDQWQIFFGEGTLKKWRIFDTTTSQVNNFAYLSTNRLIDTHNVKLPNNNFIRQYPKYGNGAIMLINYRDSMQSNAYWTKSITRAKLNKKLIAGQQYCATIYASAEERPGYYFTNGLNLYFDNGQLDTIYYKHHDSSATYRFVSSQVSCNYLLNDTTNWMKVQNTFIANGTETYITIGNFRDDDSLIKQPNGWGPNLLKGQEILIDNVSLIPIDLSNWLQDVYVAAGDSVWVGLDWRDYSDGIWYTSTMQPIDTMPGFWYKPELPVTTFIQGVDICGVMKYDTMQVYIAPSSINTEAKNKLLRIFPNPAKDVVYLEKLSAVSIEDDAVFYNCVGQVVAKQRMTMGKNTIDISALPRGLYFIRYGGFEYKLEVR